MPDGFPEETPLDGLVDRVELIESQALSARAASYAELQEQLRKRLEDADPRR